MSKQIFKFGQDVTDGSATDKVLLGGKGANLAEMCNLGLPIPPGFTITTEVCNEYRASSDKLGFLNIFVDDQVMPQMADLSKHLGYEPLVSVRSGAFDSMPGMMDTILNVGLSLDSECEQFWIDRVGKKVVLDCYRRLYQMYCETAYKIPHEEFEWTLNKVRGAKYGMDEAPRSDAEMSIKHLRQVIKWFEETFDIWKPGFTFPDTLKQQLRGSIKAVFDSWDNPRAIAFRKMYSIPEDWGTAVNVQAMVFGNMNEISASGVIFTRNPANGINEYYGDYLNNGQGEEVVAGIRPTKLIAQLEKEDAKLFAELADHCSTLENHYKDMQDIEFTIEDGKLYLLQTRTGRRSAEAAFKIAVELVQEGIITKTEALTRVTAQQYTLLNKPRIDPSFKVKPDVVGVPAGGGIITGVAVLTSDEAVMEIADCILVRDETTPDDIEGMKASMGILTRTGGATSHAAVVARGMDKSCVVGCIELDHIESGRKITIDGSTGNVWFDVDVPVLNGLEDASAEQIVAWATDQAGDFVERVMGDPNLEMGKLSKRVYFDTVALDDNAADLAGLLTSIDKSELDEVYLDLRSKYDHLTDDDLVLWGAFGEKVSPLGTLEKKLNTLVSSVWKAKLKKRVTLFIPTYAEAIHIEALKNAKWTLATKVETVEDLMNSDGIIDLTPKFEESVGGKTAVTKLLRIFKEAGRDLKGMPEAMTRKRRVFDILGTGE